MKANQCAKLERHKFGFVDPKSIMMAIIALIVLGVGVFAFFTTVTNMPNTYTPPSATTSTAENDSYFAFVNNTRGNATNTAVSVFNIVGVILLIGAIMSIVGLVYGYVKQGGL